MEHDVEQLFRDSGLTAPAHRVNETRLHRLLGEDYGLSGRLRRVDTEKDATYRLAPTEGGSHSEREFLVKVSQPDEPSDVVQCQVDAVRWIEHEDPEIPVQTILPARDGAHLRVLTDEAGEYCGRLRVHRFIPGTMLADADPTPAQLRTVGSMLGRIDGVLSGFTHPGAERVLVWDLTRFLQFEALIDQEPDAERRSGARAVFDAYRTWVAPRLSTARTQVIHGDFSPFNVVVDPEAEDYVTGVIDFGDVVRSPLVFDPAVLLGNHLLAAPEHPWVQARALLDGYRATLPLSDEEVGLVAVASAARVTLRALIANWRVRRGTDRADYVMEHARHDWGRVANVVAHGFSAARAYLLHHD